MYCSTNSLTLVYELELLALALAHCQCYSLITTPTLSLFHQKSAVHCEFPVHPSRIIMSETSAESQSLRKTQKRKPKRIINWKKIKEFPNRRSALNFMCNKWCKLITNNCCRQKSVTYYCAEHGKKCSARAKLVYPNSKDEDSVVLYYEATAEHDYERSDNGLPLNVKKIIEEILKDEHKSLIPLTEALIARGVDPVPPRNQLQNFLKNRQKAVQGSAKKNCDSTRSGGYPPESNSPDQSLTSGGPSRRPGRPRKVLAQTAVATETQSSVSQPGGKPDFVTLVAQICGKEPVRMRARKEWLSSVSSYVREKLELHNGISEITVPLMEPENLHTVKR